jgi:hypothetical protein
VGVLLLDEGSTATTDKAEGAGGAGAPTRRARLSIVCRDAEVPRCWVARNRLLKSNPLVSADLQAFREVLRWGVTACHAERSRVRIPSAASKRPACAGLFRCSSRAVRLRHRTMTRQSCPRQLADAGRNASRQDGLPRIARKYQGFRQGTDSQDGGDSGRQAVVCRRAGWAKARNLRTFPGRHGDGGVGGAFFRRKHDRARPSGTGAVR